MMLAQAAGLGDGDREDLPLLVALHDIGKIVIPVDILNKRGPLAAEEWETVKKHTEIGYRIANSTPQLSSIAEAILAHHERWDGTGYPAGLAGEAIPLLARIIAIVDAYDVMTNGRPYKDACNPTAALAELEKMAGKQFDPDLVQRFVAGIYRAAAPEAAAAGDA
jgi:HD-GYP domain-containing protein (c-di-GMP phosphodiesterase class II)